MANNPLSTPEQQADAILGVGDRLVTGFSTDALLEAFSDVIEILEGLNGRNEAALSPQARADNKKRISALLVLLSKIRSRLNELFEMTLEEDEDYDDTSEKRVKPIKPK